MATKSAASITRGKYFNSRGPFTVPRSEQGHPVVIQAGQSARGKKFAAKWGELLFVGSPPTLDIGRQNYKQIKEAVAAQRPRSEPRDHRAVRLHHLRRDRRWKRKTRWR